MRAKGILFLIVISSLFVACGKKDNKAAGGGGIDNHEVQTMKSNLSTSRFQAVSVGHNYSFTACKAGYQSGDWKSFTIPNRLSDCRYGHRKINSSGQVTHANGNTEAEVQTYLNDLLSRVVEIKDHTAKDCYIEFKANDGYIYIIDRTHPLVTNPVSKRTESGTKYNLYSGYTRPTSDSDCSTIGSSSVNHSDNDFFFN